MLFSTFHPIYSMKQKNTKRSSRISWHPAFVEALQMELQEYRDDLEFVSEYPLAAEPLKIDCIVIKKAKGAVIKKNIGAIFREWNVIEYKSPGDYVSVADFYKVYGYTCLYASFERIPITSLTVTFVESRHSQKLLRHLRDERGYAVAENHPGIYTVTGDVLPIQVIDSRRLPADENLWLKSLSDRLDKGAFSRISSEIYRQGKAAQIAAYLDVIARANTKTMKEVMQMSDVPLEIAQIFEETGWAARWEARGRDEGRTEGEEIGRRKGGIEIARNALTKGLSIEMIHDITGLPAEEITNISYQ